MSHHGSHPFSGNDNVDPEAQARVKELMGKILGEFPEGKLNKEDEGALAMMIGEEQGKVVIKFPKPIAWIGFTPEQAVQIAQSLIQQARKAGFNSVLNIRL